MKNSIVGDVQGRHYNQAPHTSRGPVITRGAHITSVVHISRDTLLARDVLITSRLKPQAWLYITSDALISGAVLMSKSLVIRAPLI